MTACGSQQEIEGLKAVLKPLHEQPSTTRDRIRQDLSHVELRLRTTRLGAHQDLNPNSRGATKRRPQTARTEQEHNKYVRDDYAHAGKDNAQARAHAHGNQGARSAWLGAHFEANHGKGVNRRSARESVVHDHDAGARPVSVVSMRTRRIHSDQDENHMAGSPQHEHQPDGVKDVNVHGTSGSGASSEASMQRTVSAVQSGNSDGTSRMQVNEDNAAREHHT
jgi:hypothetical protein